MTFDRAYWEELWRKTLREHGDRVATKPPNPRMVDIAEQLSPGRVLDAGCGHGAESRWLAGHGWTVTAVDFSASALAHARATTESMSADIASRITWLEGDLGVWAPPAEAFDFVVCLHVHVAGSVEEMVQRLGSGVAPGGTLLLVGYRPLDREAARGTEAQTQVSLDEGKQALDPTRWVITIAEEQPRTHGPHGFDAVIVAKRRG